MPDKGSAQGPTRLNPQIEAVIDASIREYFLTREKPRVADLWRYVQHACADRDLRAPNYRTVQRRVQRFDRQEVVRSRDGEKAAHDQFAPVAGDYHADYALEVVQVDHTRVDVIIVDDYQRQPIGRPWLTLLIDIASRTIPGFYLSLEAPSATSVAMALRHAVLPKDAWLATCDVPGTWPVSGLPDRLHMDNAREFHSRALMRGCDEYGVERVYRPIKTPHFGGHIERLIGTTMGAVHLLPGSTSSSVADKGDYDAESAAVMTLSELERWLTLQIVGIYHATAHRSLMVPPVTAWDDALLRRPVDVRHPADPTQFLLDFLPFEYRRVRRDGIQLFNIHYWDNVLTAWAGRSDQRMPVKYDPRDLSRVFLQTPDGDHWPVPYRDLRRPPITLFEHRAAMAALRERGRRAVDEALIFATVEAQRALVAAAMTRTKAARKTAQRIVCALGATMDDGDERQVPRVTAADPPRQLPAPVALGVIPFEIEELS